MSKIMVTLTTAKRERERRSKGEKEERLSLQKVVLPTRSTVKT